MKTAYFNRFCLSLPAKCVKECSASGACDEAVAAWTPKIDFRQVLEDDIRKELKEYGAWDSVELQDKQANRERIVWIAAGNIKEEEAEKQNKNRFTQFSGK